MGLAKNFIGGGFSAAQAQALNSSVIGSSLTATGTTQATALALTADLNIISAGGDGAGAILYNGQIGDSQEVFNDQLTNLRIYPPTGAKINQVATNGCVIVPAYTYAFFKKCTATRWGAFMSA